MFKIKSALLAATLCALVLVSLIHGQTAAAREADIDAGEANTQSAVNSLPDLRPAYTSRDGATVRFRVWNNTMVSAGPFTVYVKDRYGNITNTYAVAGIGSAANPPQHVELTYSIADTCAASNDGARGIYVDVFNTVTEAIEGNNNVSIGIRCNS